MKMRKSPAKCGRIGIYAVFRISAEFNYNINNHREKHLEEMCKISFMLITGSCFSSFLSKTKLTCCLTTSHIVQHYFVNTIEYFI